MNYPSSTLEALHRLTTRHRKALESAAVCGCFYCLTTFPPTAISDWIDEDNDSGATALCPHCGIDSVVPELAERLLTADLLSAMHAYWFERTVSMASDPSFLQRVRLRLEPVVRRLKWDWGPRNRAV